MTDSTTNRPETRPATLLIGILFPDVDRDTDPEITADTVVAILNEERVRNGGVDAALDDDAGFDRPEVEPVMVSAIPPAQWMTSETLTRLRHSEELRIAAEAEVAVAYDVIRRLRAGYFVMSFADPRRGQEWWGGRTNDHDEHDKVTSEQRAALDAATKALAVLDAVAGPNDTEENP